MKTLCSFFMFLVICLSVKSQSYNIDYSHSTYFRPYRVIENYSNQYLFSVIRPPNNWMILRTDSSGNVLSNWDYYSGGSDFNPQIILTPDSGYVLYGQSSQALLLKLDKNGNITWQKYLYGIGKIHDVLVSYDGNLMVAAPIGLGFGIVKMDITNGNIIWNSRSSQMDNNTYVLEIIRNFNGGYTAAGVVTISNQINGMIAEFDVNGIVLWQNSFTLNFAAGGVKNICQLSDSGYVMICNVNNTDYLYKIDKYGSTQWCERLDYINALVYWQLLAKPGGFYLLCQDKVGTTYYKAAEFDNSGGLVFFRNITEAVTTGSFTADGDFIRTSTGSILMTGLKDASNGKVKVVKLLSDFSGCSNSALTATLIYGSPVQGAGLTFVNSTLQTGTPVFSFANLSATSATYCSLVASESSQIVLDADLVFPNPSNGIVNCQLSMDNSEDVLVEVFDVLGKKCFTSIIHSTSNIQIDLSGQPDGLYLINFYTEKRTISKKLIVFH
jgi:hypothetical protein